MIEISRPNIQFFQFPGLSEDPRVIHAVSSRGKNPSRNMSFSAGKRHGDPEEARTALFEALGLPLEKLVVAGQVHGARVEVITAGNSVTLAHNGSQKLLADTDGLLTETPGQPLLVTAADCPPVFLFDPETPAVGVVHSGWRGTCARIVSAAVEKMRETFRTDARNVRAAIGPGIGPCCYVVGEDLIEKLNKEDRSHLRRNERDRWVLDLPSWISEQLRVAGVPQESIETSGYCTACHVSRFFSHRAEKGDTGRVAAVIGLKA